MTYKEMAKELNCNPATIGKYVNELGITKSEICINYKDEIWMNLEKYNYSKYWISNYGRIKNEDNIILKYQKREYPFIKLTNDVTGKSISQIIKLYNGKFTKSVLQKIKYKKTWKHISKDYNF